MLSKYKINVFLIVCSSTRFIFEFSKKPKKTGISIVVYIYNHFGAFIIQSYTS